MLAGEKSIRKSYTLGLASCPDIDDSRFSFVERGFRYLRTEVDYGFKHSLRICFLLAHVSSPLPLLDGGRSRHCSSQTFPTLNLLPHSGQALFCAAYC